MKAAASWLTHGPSVGFIWDLWWRAGSSARVAGPAAAKRLQRGARQERVLGSDGAAHGCSSQEVG